MDSDGNLYKGSSYYQVKIHSVEEEIRGVVITPRANSRKAELLLATCQERIRLFLSPLNKGNKKRYIGIYQLTDDETKDFKFGRARKKVRTFVYELQN